MIWFVSWRGKISTLAAMAYIYSRYSEFESYGCCGLRVFVAQLAFGLGIWLIVMKDVENDKVRKQNLLSSLNSSEFMLLKQRRGSIGYKSMNLGTAASDYITVARPVVGSDVLSYETRFVCYFQHFQSWLYLLRQHFQMRAFLSMVTTSTNHTMTYTVAGNSNASAESCQSVKRSCPDISTYALSFSSLNSVANGTAPQIVPEKYLSGMAACASQQEALNCTRGATESDRERKTKTESLVWNDALHIGTDNANITRNRPKPDKHGHENG
ncbi:hypothetical protein Tco_0011875 [Tanacetum coccineum]